MVKPPVDQLGGSVGPIALAAGVAEYSIAIVLFFGAAITVTTTIADGRACDTAGRLIAAVGMSAAAIGFAALARDAVGASRRQTRLLLFAIAGTIIAVLNALTIGTTFTEGVLDARSNDWSMTIGIVAVIPFVAIGRADRSSTVQPQGAAGAIALGLAVFVGGSLLGLCGLN